MPRITIEVSEELSQQIAQLGVREACAERIRFPELLVLSLQQPPLPAHIYRYILDFIACNPTPEEIAAFRPTPEMQDRLRTLVERSKTGDITKQEHMELDEYEKIEHLVIMLKAGNLRNLTSTR